MVGAAEEAPIATWSNHIELLAQVEDTHDGASRAAAAGRRGPPERRPGHDRPLSYQLSEQSIRVRELADKAMRQVVERRGLARLMRLTETQGVYCAHPLGGCRMADSKDLGVVDHRCEAFDNEGLFCIDSSAIPTSLGVNPSLTISAVAERAAAGPVSSARPTTGSRRRRPGFRHRRPGVTVGERVVPRRSRARSR